MDQIAIRSVARIKRFGDRQRRRPALDQHAGGVQDNAVQIFRFHLGERKIAAAPCRVQPFDIAHRHTVNRLPRSHCVFIHCVIRYSQFKRLWQESRFSYPRFYRSVWSRLPATGQTYFDSPRMLKQFTCKECGKEFSTDVTPSGTARRAYEFCSVACHTRSRTLKNVPCPVCGTSFHPKRGSSHGKYQRQTYCTGACARIANGLKLRGDNSPNWKGGRATENPSDRGVNWRTQSHKARKRDNYTCQNCGKHRLFGLVKIDVHHIIPYRDFDGDYESANQLSNLILLCPSCHKRVDLGVIPCPHPKP